MKKLIILAIVALAWGVAGAERFTFTSNKYRCEKRFCCICEKQLYEKVKIGIDEWGGPYMPHSYPEPPILGPCEGERMWDHLSYEFNKPICVECDKKYQSMLTERIDIEIKRWLSFTRDGEHNRILIQKNRKLNAEREQQKKDRKILELENKIKKLKGEPYDEISMFIDGEPVWKSGVSKITSGTTETINPETGKVIEDRTK